MIHRRPVRRPLGLDGNRRRLHDPARRGRRLRGLVLRQVERRALPQRQRRRRQRGRQLRITQKIDAALSTKKHSIIRLVPVTQLDTRPLLTNFLSLDDNNDHDSLGCGSYAFA